MESQKGNAVVWVLAVAVVAIIAFLAYQQGYLGGTAASPEPSSGIHINY